MRIAKSAICLSIGLSCLLAFGQSGTPTYTRVSAANSGKPANASCVYGLPSGDGSAVAFASYATNLLPGDYSNTSDIFLYNRSLPRLRLGAGFARDYYPSMGSASPSLSFDGQRLAFVAYDIAVSTLQAYVRDLPSEQIINISVNNSGTFGNSSAQVPSISSSGNFVAFISQSTNLTPNDTDSSPDVYLRDINTGTTELISISTSGANAKSTCRNCSINADGRFVSFESNSKFLDPRVTTTTYTHLYVRDRLLGTTTLVDNAMNGNPSAVGVNGSYISGDGNWIGFTSTSSNFLPGDTNGKSDGYLLSLVTGKYYRASITTDGSESNGSSLVCGLSSDGSKVAVLSNADNIVPNDGNADYDCFIYDRVSNSIRCISLTDDGQTGEAESGYYGFNISADGNTAVITTSANNLVSNDLNPYKDVIVVDLVQNTKALISLSGDGIPADTSVYGALHTPDCRYSVYTTNATNLDGNSDGTYGLYLFDEETRRVELLSYANDGHSVHSPSPQILCGMSADARYVAFESSLPDYVDNDTNGFGDTFVRDRKLGTTTLATLSYDGKQLNSPAYGVLTANGKEMFFTTAATNVVPSGQDSGSQVYVRNLETGTVDSLVWEYTGGKIKKPLTTAVLFSPDGRFVEFVSDDDLIVPGDTNGRSDGFLLDRATGSVIRVSTMPDGSDMPAPIGVPLTLDGRFAWFTTSVGFDPVDTNGLQDTYLKDLSSGEIRLVTTNASGQVGEKAAYADIDLLSRFAAITTASKNYRGQSSSGINVVYFKDLLSGELTTVSATSSGKPEDGDAAGISVDGSRIYFRSMGSGIIPGDFSSHTQLYVWDRGVRRTRLTLRVNFNDWAGLQPVDGVAARTKWNGYYYGLAYLKYKDGAFVGNVPRGDLEIFVSHDHWLTQSIHVDTTGQDTAEVSVALPNGDVDADNRVDLRDLNGVFLSWDTDDATADRDGDGLVGLTDLSIVFGNFGLIGSEW